MSMRSIAAVVIVLVAFFVFSQIWFHSVEAVIAFFKRLFHKKDKPATWHIFPEENDDNM